MSLDNSVPNIALFNCSSGLKFSIVLVQSDSRHISLKLQASNIYSFSSIFFSKSLKLLHHNMLSGVLFNIFFAKMLIILAVSHLVIALFALSSSHFLFTIHMLLPNVYAICTSLDQHISFIF